MSENEIKPVAWTSETQLSAVRKSGDGIMASTSGQWKIALYDQSAIDRLTAERDDWRRQAWHETDVAAVAVQEVERLKAERDFAREESLFLRSHRPIARRLNELEAELATARAERDAAAEAFTRLFVEHKS